MTNLNNMNQAELVAAVAAAAVKGALAASAGRPGTLKPPTVPTPARPIRPALAPARPVRPTHTTRGLTAAAVRDRLAVAVHEAGHAVAGVVLGAELHTVILAPEGTELRGNLKGQTFFRGLANSADDALIAYAGPWAQAKFAAGSRRPTQRQFYALMDTTGCRDRAVLTAAGGMHEGAGVVPILDRCWDAVLTVARKLHTTGEAHRDDVLAALGVTDGGGYYSGQLASIRSGSHPIPPYTKTPQPA